MKFIATRLWTVEGRVRRAANDAIPAHRSPGGWEDRRVVFTAGEFPQAHKVAEDALKANYSRFPLEATIHALRPVTTDDMAEFAFSTDYALRVLVPE